MEPEKLKVIAEGMGYTVSKSTQNHCDIVVGGIVYAPLAEDIMEKLKIGVAYSKETKLWFSHYGETINDCSSGETIQEAVCNAAFEFFKEDV